MQKSGVVFLVVKIPGLIKDARLSDEFGGHGHDHPHWMFPLFFSCLHLPPGFAVPVYADWIRSDRAAHNQHANRLRDRG